MTQYLLSLPHDSADEPTMESMDPADLEAVFAAVEGFNNRIKDDGAWVFAGGLHPPSSATTVDATGDAPIYTDGPFVEAKEYFGGFLGRRGAGSGRRAGVRAARVEGVGGPDRGARFPGSA